MDDDDGRLVPEPEEQREHDEHPEPETGDGDEEDGERAGHVVDDAVGLDRAQDADGEADEPRHDEREEADLGADRPAVEDELGDRVAAKERLAELPRGDVPEPVKVLERERVGEAEIVHDLDAVRRRHPRVTLHAKDGHQRVAGQDAQHDEDDQRHPNEGRQGKQRPPDEIFAHARGPLPLLSRPAGFGGGAG